MAEDVTQNVFLRLATKPESVPSRIPLGVWLHRTTTSLAIDLVRSEEARKKRSALYAEINPPNPMNWSTLAPEIDEALEKLSEADRSAIILRYFENRSLQQIATALGIQEKSAHMRVKRALEKLRSTLAGRGIVTSAAFLSTSLSAQAVTTAPAHLSSSILSACQASLGIGVIHSTISITSIVMNAKAIARPAACLALLAVTSWQRTTITERRQALESSKSQNHSGLAGHSRSSARDSASSASQNDILLARIRHLAGIEPLSAREAALMDWAEGFDSSEQITDLAKLLREAAELSPKLRTRVANALTARWALIDPAGAMDAHAGSLLASQASPFGKIEQDPWDSSNSAIDIIARSNPDGFNQWLKDNQAILQDLVTGEAVSADSRRLFELDARGKTTPSGQPEPGAEKWMTALVLARNAPVAVLELYRATRAAGHGDSLAILDPDVLGKALIAEVDSPGDFWKLFKEEDHAGFGPDFFKGIARGLSMADTRPQSEVLAELATLSADWSTPFRLETAGDGIAQAKASLPEGDNVAQEQRWTDFESYGNLINSKANSADSRFDWTRRKMAALAAAEDKEAGVQWAKSLVDPDLRRDTAAQVALASHGGDGWSYDKNSKAFVRVETRGESHLQYRTRGPQLDLNSDLSVEEIVRLTDQTIEQSDLTPPPKSFGGLNPLVDETIFNNIGARRDAR